MDVRGVVVAVRGVVDETLRGLAAGGRRTDVAVAIPVAVRVPGRGSGIVAVAVVVDPVAELLRPRVHVGIGVVAVAGLVDEARDRTAGHLARTRAEAVLVAIDPECVADPFVDFAVAVVVDLVALLDAVRVRQGVVVVAVLALRPTVAVRVDVDVGLATSCEQQPDRESHRPSAGDQNAAYTTDSPPPPSMPGPPINTSA